MEGQSVKEKIFYWGGITLITSVIIGGSYYIYKSIFGLDENEKNNIDNDNDSLDTSFMLNKNNQNNNINNNINNINNENNIDNNNISNNINSSLFPKINNSLIESDNNNIISTKININNEENNEINNENNNNNSPKNNINIFNNNKLLLKSFGINIDESKLLINNNRLTDESAVLIIIYINYLAQKFYLIDNPTLDQKRRALLTNNIKENGENNINNNTNEINMNNEQKIQEEYLTLCNQTMKFRENCYQIAAEKILGSLHIKITFQELEDFLKNVEPNQMEKITLKLTTELNDELYKYDLDYFDLNKTKEAFIFYLKANIDAIKILYEEQKKIKKNNEDIGNEIIEQNNIFIFKLMSMKMQMDDKLYLKYHIEDEHLKLLANKYNLFNDSEISQLQKEFDDFNHKIDNPN